MQLEKLGAKTSQFLQQKSHLHYKPRVFFKWRTRKHKRNLDAGFSPRITYKQKSVTSKEFLTKERNSIKYFQLVYLYSLCSFSSFLFSCFPVHLVFSKSMLCLMQIYITVTQLKHLKF